SRWWLIKSIARLGASGLWTVEFTDFWLGDQFCSLVYSFSNLYFVGCFYTKYFPKAWTTCGTELNWGAYFAFAMLPFLVRFVQSLRRYGDSKLPTHLINAGKYGMGIVYYFCYFLWRRDEANDNTTFVLWCLSAIIYTLYGCAWDFFMDWSICKPRAKYPLLRRELVYTSHIPLYYVALVTNFSIRFLWVFYIPSWQYKFTLRTFIVGLLEMLRRIQWNVYRLENEHLGNMDQYRIIREVPLPYSFDNPQDDDEDDETV
ncbi:EXS-domain-containing protein, partial [Suillus paluster]|uniref:EXS-domain-containing protein n=1 Tax=Suillus paluster TaxID=48578 RepID=UPI001B877097